VRMSWEGSQPRYAFLIAGASARRRFESLSPPPIIFVDAGLQQLQYATRWSYELMRFPVDRITINARIIHSLACSALYRVHPNPESHLRSNFATKRTARPPIRSFPGHIRDFRASREL
jgi:hypothetical protein